MDVGAEKKDHAVILMAHGSRHSEGKRQAEALMEEIQCRCRFPVDRAYLEILEPDLESCLDNNASRHNQIFILPLLIFRGGHALRDIPEMVSRCREKHPDLKLSIGPVLEPRDRLLDFWVDFYRENVERETGEKVVILMGRGAVDREAREAFAHVSKYLEVNLGRPVLNAFTGLQDPDLPSVLRKIDPGTPLLIFPCLLFDGVLLEKARETVGHRNVTWAPTLARSPFIVEKVLDVIEEGMKGF